MRILLVNNFAYVTGGADRHCLELTDALRQRGHEVAWLSTHHHRNVEEAGAFVRLPITAADREALSWVQGYRAFRRALWNSDAAEACRILLRDFRPDVVHAHKLYVQLSVAPVVVCAHAQAPIVQTVHDYEFLAANPFDSSGSRLDRTDELLQARVANTATYATRACVHRSRVSRWVAVSNHVARVHAESGVRCEVLPNFIARPPSVRASRSGRSAAVAFVGRLESEKGVQHVLDMAAYLPETTIRIAGEGSLKGKVRDAARTRRNVTYLGQLDAQGVEDLLRSSLVAVMPSVWDEPGPLAAIEAMATGTPLVASARGGLSEYVENAQAGVVVEQIDGRGLASAARLLLNDADFWRTCADNGVNAAQTTHSLDRYVTRIEEVYMSTQE